MHKKILKNKGFILIEVIISIAIFAIFAGAMVSMILGSFSVMQKGADYSFATNLSQEGIEVIRIIREGAWNELKYAKSALVFEDIWFLAGEETEERIDKFDRYIEFEAVYRDLDRELVSFDYPGAVLDINSLNINSVVAWQENEKLLSVSNKTMFTNWESDVWEQNTWLGGLGQAVYVDEDKFFENSNIKIGSTLILEEISTSTFAIFGSLQSSDFGPVDIGIFSSILWEENIPEFCNDCLVKVQIKTADDFNGIAQVWSDTWCGPRGEDNNEDDYFLNSQGELLSTDHKGDKWIKYRVILEGTEEYSPELEKIKIYYK